MWPYFDHRGKYREPGSGTEAVEKITRSKSKVLVHEFKVTMSPKHAVGLDFYNPDVINKLRTDPFFLDPTITDSLISNR